MKRVASNIVLTTMTLLLAESIVAPQHAAAAERLFARESFAYVGSLPIALDELGSDTRGWGGPWRANGPYGPVFVDRHTINNPFGSGHGVSHRASNHSGELRSSVRNLRCTFGETGTTVQVGFAMMQHFAPQQDGSCGGIELSLGDNSKLFIGNPLHGNAFALATQHSSPTEALRATPVRVASKGELFVTNYILATIEFGDDCDTATLQVFDCFGLPLCQPVSQTFPDLSFDRLALFLDDQQIDEIEIRCENRRDVSPIHFRPPGPGRMADTIPFFWQGEYHIFYLRAVGKVPWEHIVSRDLIHWKQLPTALITDGEPNSADGMNMFTGSVIQRDGTFHIFYAGWNVNNPQGREFVMHATSDDLIHWTKHPTDIFGPDGQIYANTQARDFRDPYVFFNADEDRYWMLLCTGAQTGVAVSKDLIRWQVEQPLDSDYAGLGTPECPDYFQIGDTHYLIMSPTETESTLARYAPNIRGPYLAPPASEIDTAFLYAAKRMYDGRRHVITGWLRDLEGEQDGGRFLWGGTQCVPREVYAGPHGQLYFRPVPEAKRVFDRVVRELGNTRQEATTANETWTWHDGALVGRGASTPAIATLAVPDNYLLECTLRLSQDAQAELVLRRQPATTTGYRLRLLPAQQRVELGGRTFCYGRSVPLPESESIRVTALVQGSIIECFVNDAYALSCRAYDYPRGEIALYVHAGSVEVQELTVSISGGGAP